MNETLNYLIEVNIALLFFYVCYWVLFREENQFSFKRAYLLTSIIASLVFPVISIPTYGTQYIPSISNSQAVVLLPEIAVNSGSAYTTVEQPTSIWHWISYIYYSGLILSLVIFIIRITSLIKLFLTSKKYVWKNYTVAESEKTYSSFSFFHLIFVGQAQELTTQEKEAMLVHEEAHVQKYHSIDIVITNILGIVFWFNPIIHLYRNSLVQVHEFEADARSVEGRDVNAYCSLLARVALRTNGYPLANHFTNSFTIKRIHMIKTIKKRISSWKLITGLSVLVINFFAVSCQDQINSPINNDSKPSLNLQELPFDVKIALERMESENPGSKFEVIEMTDEGQKYLKSTYNSENINQRFPHGMILYVVKDTQTQRMFTIIGEDARKKLIASLSVNETDTFNVVDANAKPLFGMEHFYKDITHSIIYPEHARKNQIQGTVYLEFLIDTKGDISNVNIAKGVNEFLEEEAIRVFLQIQSKWLPAIHNGQVVKQKLVLPITFKLSEPKQNQSFNYFDTESKKDKSKNEQGELNEIVVVGHTQN